MNAPESPAPAHRPRSLFRQEAIDAQREKLLGELSTARPVPLWIFTLLAVAFAVVFVVFAFVGEYTRRERVEGFLVGDAGRGGLGSRARRSTCRNNRGGRNKRLLQ